MPTGIQPQAGDLDATNSAIRRILPLPPAPVIQTFLLNDDVMEWTKIDACITVCDASQIVLRLEEDREEGCENEAVE